jgi:ribonuclease BN (tRNA processing enzyme)
VFDTHFSTNNLKADWGHATPDIAIELCSKANVKRLFMFHHAPEATDHDVARKQASAQYTAMEHGIEVINAREEDEWLLTAA